jgi:hypothetical protein
MSGLGVWAEIENRHKGVIVFHFVSQLNPEIRIYPTIDGLQQAQEKKTLNSYQVNSILRPQ